MKTLIGLMALAMTTGGLAQAQDRGPDRLPERTLGPNVSPQGVRVLMPGGLLLASYDANGDLMISPEEIREGARRSFQYADRDADGILTPLEQKDWAIRITDENDPAANPTVFDPNLDRQVLEEEFVSGMLTLSEILADDEGNVRFEDLSRVPDRSRRRARTARADAPERIGRVSPASVR